MPNASISRRALLAGLGATLVTTRRAAAGTQGPSSPWASLELVDSEDRSFLVADAGKPYTLIRLWANWCSVCMSELGSMPAVAASLAAHDIETIMVSSPQDWSRDHAIARNRNLGLRCARPSANNRASVVQADLMAENGWFYVPRTVLFSREKQAAVWSHVGRLDWADPRTLELIAAHTV